MTRYAIPIRDRSARSRGFTLIELVVVIGMIGLLAGLLFPAISVLSGGSRVEAGMNTLSVAVTTARAYATRDIAFTADLLPDPRNPRVQFSIDGYSGVAMLFCPSNEIRIVENDERTIGSNVGPLELAWVNLEDDPDDPPKLVYRNGFRDLEGVDYIQMPHGVGFAGLSRGGAGRGEVLVLAPPFAVRLDQHGHITHGRPGSSPDRVVFYNGNYDHDVATGWALVNVANDRGSASRLDPDHYDATSPQYDINTAWVETDDLDNQVDKHGLPFEAIDAVIGVIIYDKSAFWGAFHEGWDSYSTSTRDPDYIERRDWILANGKAVFFNRYTGAMIKD